MSFIWEGVQQTKSKRGENGSFLMLIFRRERKEGRKDAVGDICFTIMDPE